jgi:phosphoribosyl 1,2-cyclic phosphodiesterase
VPVHLTVLGSGSSGNSAYLETSETRLLIDAGLSARQIRQRLLTIGRTPENLTGILITHEHSDHTQALSVLAAKLQIPVYCNRLTKEAIEVQFQARLDFRLFATGASFELGDVEVDTFSVPHDAYDPVGFLVRTCAGNFGFLTDLGHATKLAIERVRTANVLLLEANHDVKMLQDDPRRPWSLKQRILSRHGHLSNETAAQVAEQIVTAELRQLYLAHLSADCNRPELARRVVGDTLHKLGATHVQMETAWQDRPCATFAISPALEAASTMLAPASADAVG